MKKYTSIDNCKTEHAEWIRANCDSRQFVAQEKVHGCNLSIQYNFGEVRVASRTQFLGDNASFYNFQAALGDNIKERLIEFIAKKNENGFKINRYIIYGELCGGEYPGMNSSDSIQVQKKIFYAPGNKYIPFDVFRDGVMINDIDGLGEYADIHEVGEVAEALGFAKIPVLATGTFSECLDVPVEFESLVPALYGLPPVPDRKNIAEGLVIKPTEALADRFGNRFIVKRKSERFIEIDNEKVLKRVKFENDEETKYFRERAFSFCNSNRLDNVISNLGREESSLTVKDIGKLIGLLAIDTITDFNKEYGEDFDKIDKGKQKIVKQVFSSQSSIIVKSYFQHRGLL